MNQGRDKSAGAALAFAAALSATAFAVLWWEQSMHGGGTTVFDRALLLALHRYKSPVGDALTWGMAFLGSLWVVFGVALFAVIVAFASHKRQAKQSLASSETHAIIQHAGRVMPLACVGGTLLVEAAKGAAHRPRPDLFVPLFRATGYSFPSGHAFLGLTVFGLLGYFAHKESMRRNAHSLGRGALVLSASLLVFAMGVSRVYAGVHYPTDVLAGWAGAATWLLICLRICRS